MLKKVVVIGPESTGKSTLCAKLSAHFKTDWVKEYAREYLIAHGTHYTFDNLLEVAKGQIDMEESAIQKMTQGEEKKSSGLLFIDTDMYVMKVWCEFVFNQCHHWVLNKIVERKYDLYLLCNIDQPWIKDELREYPDLVTREKLYHHYKDIMINQQVPWVDISGNYEERLEKAIAAVNELRN
jgi:NadR type nicotinamide-nucleotide adenylyltransferase